MANVTVLYLFLDSKLRGYLITVLIALIRVLILASLEYFTLPAPSHACAVPDLLTLWFS
jgi:hypothetical protein